MLALALGWLADKLLLSPVWDRIVKTFLRSTKWRRPEMKIGLRGKPKLSLAPNANETRVDLVIELDMKIESDEHQHPIVIRWGYIVCRRRFRPWKTVTFPIAGFAPEDTDLLAPVQGGISIPPFGAIQGVFLAGGGVNRDDLFSMSHHARIVLEFRGFRPLRRTVLFDWTKLLQ